MKVDSAVLTEPSDIVVPPVTTLPASPPANTMVYLTQVYNTFNPGLYLYTEAGAWVLLSNGNVVT